MSEVFFIYTGLYDVCKVFLTRNNHVIILSVIIFRLICLVVCSNQLFQAMVTILSIFTLPCLFSCIVVGQNCNEAIEGWVNGCSIPFGIDFFYKERFKLACNKHDHCYNCVRIPMYLFYSCIAFKH